MRLPCSFFLITCNLQINSLYLGSKSKTMKRQYANTLTNNNQVILSASGRFAKWDRVLYTAYDDIYQEVFYKTSPYAGSNIRIGRSIVKPIIYPNPATDYIQLNLGQEIEIAKIVIYDASGRIVLEDDYFELNSRIQTDNFEQGVYFIRITADNYNKTSKFIIL